jgi:hypothetical protein
VGRAMGLRDGILRRCSAHTCVDLFAASRSEPAGVCHSR